MENGVFAAGRELLQASQNVHASKDGSDGTKRGDLISEDVLNNGTLFAVIFKRDTRVDGDELASTNAWHAVWGTATGGYDVSEETGLASVLDAVNAQKGSTHEGYGVYTFDRNRANVLTTTIDELPGILSEYYWLLKEQGGKTEDARFAVSVYFARGKKSIGEISSVKEIVQVYSHDFERTYSAKLNVPNIKNKLYVQKVDGAALEGDKLYEGVADAEFSLYAAKDVAVGDDGAVTIADNAEPYDKVTTSENVDLKELEYGACFPSAGKVLKNGVYYLKETKAPQGYKLNPTITKVIVDGTGVYADAGTDTDDVSVSVGVGRLVKSLAQFATNDKLDNTLSNITAQPELGKVADGGNTLDQEGWQEDNLFTPAQIHLKHTDDAPLEYALSYDQGIATPGYTTTSVWPRLKVRQCVEHGEQEAANNGANYAVIGSDKNNPAEITQLFSGTTVVHVGDESLASLEVKKVVGPSEGEAQPDERTEFSFKVEVNTGALDQQDRVPPYVYRVFNTDADESEGDYKRLLEDGTIKIRAGQTFRMYEVPVGAQVTVTEVDLPDGYELTKVAKGDGSEVAAADGSVTWELVANDSAKMEIVPTNSLTFANTYTPPLTPVPPITDKPVTDQPVTDKPTTDKPTTDQPVTDKPITDKPATDDPVTDPVTEHPTTDQPSTDDPATGDPDTPATDSPDVPLSPATSDTPGTPGDPDDPSRPGTPGKPEGDDPSVVLPQTGDAMPSRAVIVGVAVLAVALVGIGAYLRVRE